MDSYLQIEANNLNYIKFNQSKLRSDLYAGLADHLANAAHHAQLPAGRPVILPSSFQGSPHNMTERYHDAMSIVGAIGTPDIFLTFTCNPRWHELVSNLQLSQQPTDRPDLIARVFKLKLDALLTYIRTSNTFGRVMGWVYDIKLKKTKVCHTRMSFFIMHPDDKFRDALHIDGVVMAEIPDTSHHTLPNRNKMHDSQTLRRT